MRENSVSRESTFDMWCLCECVWLETKPKTVKGALWLILMVVEKVT